MIAQNFVDTFKLMRIFRYLIFNINLLFVGQMWRKRY
jgi:hypothetical protein